MQHRLLVVFNRIFNHPYIAWLQDKGYPLPG